MPVHAAGTPTATSFVNGAWRVGRGETLRSLNPATGAEVIAFHAADATEVGEAVNAARAAAPEWAGTSPLERQALLLDVAARIEAQEDELVSAVVAEVGKPIREAREEVQRGAAIVRYHAAVSLDPRGETIPSPAGDAFVYTVQRPLGPVGLITPWNFPVAIPLWKITPALAYRNTVVLKPAPHATAVARKLVSLFSDFPKGVANLVSGGAETGQALARSSLRGLSFTGSTAVGTAVGHLAIESGARYQAEMGGKNASVVLADADVDQAAATIASAAMGYAGQKCTATSRVIVERGLAREFSEALVESIRALRVGQPPEEATDIGPLIEPAAVERVAGFVQRAKAAGARLLIGGDRLPEFGEGYFAPTLLGDVAPESELACTEVFGPVLALLVARDEQHALELANSSSYGLAGALFTRSLERGLRLAERLEAGVVRINGPTPGVVFNAPFAPTKASGVGSPEQGKAAKEFFTEGRTVSVVGI
jgi:acyl-CoA reductase-like NAD-dependent aldehyde dehydrogenase